MRFKFLFAALVLLLAFYLIADPSVGQSQRGSFQIQPPGNTDPKEQPQGKKGKYVQPQDESGGGKMGKKNKGMQMDPEQSFKGLARGGEVIVIDPNSMWMKGLAVWAEKNGIKDNKITKDQFPKYWEVKDDINKEVWGGGKGPKGNKGDKAADPGSADAGDKFGKKKKKFESEEERWEAEFRSYDVNSDGKLNEDEIARTKRLRMEWQKWDANKDGFISLEEYKAYMKSYAVARDEKKGGGPRKDGDTARVESPEPKKDDKSPTSGVLLRVIEDEKVEVVVYGKGKLPKGIPDWFDKMDRYPNDGQVSLYEWCKAKGSTADAIRQFELMDRNGDGLLTIDEVMRNTMVASASKNRAATPPEEGDEEEGFGEEEPEGTTPPAEEKVTPKVEEKATIPDTTKKGKKGKKGG